MKMSMEYLHSENVTPNSLELTETLKEEICHLNNENITKTST